MKISDEMVERAKSAMYDHAVVSAPLWVAEIAELDWQGLARSALEVTLGEVDLVEWLNEQGASIESRCRDHPCEWCGVSTVTAGAGCCVEPVLVLRLPVGGEE